MNDWSKAHQVNHEQAQRAPIVVDGTQAVTLKQPAKVEAAIIWRGTPPASAVQQHAVNCAAWDHKSTCDCGAE